MVMQSINPATEEVLESFEEFSPQQVDSALSQVHEAFSTWRKSSFDQRSAALLAIARELRADKSRWAGLITAEMGKPIVEAEAEIEKCAWNCEFYAENAERFLADEIVATNATRSLVAFEPLGTILAVMPWNFPFWQVMRHAAPALMAGDTILLKHASNVPRCALAVEEVLLDAGVPRGVFQTLLVSARAVDAIIADSRVA